MKRLAVLLILAGIVSAQAPEVELQKQLGTTLQGLRSAGTVEQRAQSLQNALAAAIDADHPPTQVTLGRFAAEMALLVGTRNLSRPQASALASETVTVLHSAGLATYRFGEAIERFQAALTGMGLGVREAGRAAGLLRSLGGEVRGPDDMHVVAER